MIDYFDFIVKLLITKQSHTFKTRKLLKSHTCIKT